MHYCIRAFIISRYSWRVPSMTTMCPFFVGQRLSLARLVTTIITTRCRRAPTGRYFFIAQGASPGLFVVVHLLSPFLGAALPRRKANARAESAAPEGARITFRFVCTQGFILGFALIPPWAMQECRPKRAHLGKC